MNSEERKKSIDFWNNRHQNYTLDNIEIDDWLDKFSDIIDNCPTPILDLGCGSGNDTLYLNRKNKQVIPCDQSINAINIIKKNFPEVNAICFNMLDKMPFEDNTFEIIIADLCLHYFREKDTFRILEEIRRILTENGKLIFRVNSTTDITCKSEAEEEIEHHLYITKDQRLKRIFNEEDIRYFFKDFDIEYLNEENMNRFNLDKKVYTCLVKKR